MMIDVDTKAFLSVVLAGIAGHGIFVKLSIDAAINKLANVIAKEYATKNDLKDDIEMHIKTMHKD